MSTDDLRTQTSILAAAQQVLVSLSGVGDPRAALVALASEASVVIDPHAELATLALVLTSRRDPWAMARAARELAVRLPNAHELVVVSDAAAQRAWDAVQAEENPRCLNVGHAFFDLGTRRTTIAGDFDDIPSRAGTVQLLFSRPLAAPVLVQVRCGLLDHPAMCERIAECWEHLYANESAPSVPLSQLIVEQLLWYPRAGVVRVVMGW